MAAIPFALSVSHFISSVGADAGFAAIIGLALLVVLYFAQARETRSLRDQAADAVDRGGQLELRVAALTRAQAPVAAPAPRVVPAPASIARATANPVAAAGNSAGPAPSVVPGAPTRRATPATGWRRRPIRRWGAQARLLLRSAVPGAAWGAGADRRARRRGRGGRAVDRDLQWRRFLHQDLHHDGGPAQQSQDPSPDQGNGGQSGLGDGGTAERDHHPKAGAHNRFAAGRSRL